MSHSRFDADGYLVQQVVDWAPTLGTFFRAVGYGLVAVCAAWISPLLIVTIILQEFWSDQVAWVFAISCGALTISYYLVFLAGRRRIVTWKDGRRSENPLYPSSRELDGMRDYWAEYDYSKHRIEVASKEHLELVAEMMEAGFVLDEAEFDPQAEKKF